ncbi:YggS family pyridoxal phosphate-dependent enzyme [Deinococcus puniceus]|uniref:Alanine racemase N-terminal domain-containing protein n=1 Tax=Deinococcus puniceus TaxID=1182568 RepID=A0A172T907_9DEIO|nr:YggS family pyridoxal phosphate-dependent enzyme [Deinococcus puniceus]ANE43426.1 hypothetical protein SU48_06215 [Deinococcus puniceus]
MSVPEVLAHLRALEAETGRQPGSVRLVAVTKGQPPEAIRERVLAYGEHALGEGRAQELRDKAALMTGPEIEWPRIEWHFIGTLQRNKIKYLKPVTLVHGIEEVWQAEAIAQAAQGWGRAPDLLLQLHNGEEQKHGVRPEQLRDVYHQVMHTGLKVRGLMVMAPDDADEGATLRLFEDTARRAHDLGLPELSMGMSSDYPLAVRAGATLVRVGRRLFL